MTPSGAVRHPRPSPVQPTGAPAGEAIAVALELIARTGSQQGTMARWWFSDRLTRIVPEPVEGSTFGPVANLPGVAIAWVRRPFPTVIREAGGVAGSIVLGGVTVCSPLGVHLEGQPLGEA